MEDLPFAYYTLSDEFFDKKYIANAIYNDSIIKTNIYFSINFKIYKNYISILIKENIEEDICNHEIKVWNNNQKKIIIDLIDFDFKYDYNNFIDITTNISNYINDYQFEYKRCGPIINIKKYNWRNTDNNWRNTDNNWYQEIPHNTSNAVNIFMNNFLDFFILFNINLSNTEKIPKWIIIIVSSFFIEDDIIKLFDF